MSRHDRLSVSTIACGGALRGIARRGYEANDEKSSPVAITRARLVLLVSRTDMNVRYCLRSVETSEEVILLAEHVLFNGMYLIYQTYLIVSVCTTHEIS